MARALYALLLSLVGAGIVHVVVLLWLPSLSERDAWSRLAAAGAPYEFVHVGGNPPVIPALDPLFYAVACRFDLSDGVVHVHAPGKVLFWSVSVYDRRGQNIYSLTDRTAADRALDLVLATPAQMIELRKSVPADFSRSLFVETDVGRGIVLVRAFVPDPTFAPGVADHLGNAACESR